MTLRDALFLGFFEQLTALEKVAAPRGTMSLVQKAVRAGTFADIREGVAHRTAAAHARKQAKLYGALESEAITARDAAHQKMLGLYDRMMKSTAGSPERRKLSDEAGSLFKARGEKDHLVRRYGTIAKKHRADALEHDILARAQIRQGVKHSATAYGSMAGLYGLSRLEDEKK